jgi:hypothetical protein
MYPDVLGVTGKVTKQDLVNTGLSSKEDIDIRRMAQWAMHYLANSPKPEFNYQPVFQAFPLKFPSVREEYDPVVDCDTDARMDWEWFFMRDVAGGKFAADVEDKFHARLRLYIGDDGLAHCHPGCYREDLKDKVYGEDDKIIHTWGTIKILRSLSLDYARNKKSERLDLAGRVVAGLRKLFVWGKDEKGEEFCYGPNGMGPVDPKGRLTKEQYGIWGLQPAPIVGPMLDDYLVSGDESALAFAKAAAKGIIESRQPGSIAFLKNGAFVIPEEGQHEHPTLDSNKNVAHTHGSLHAIWGVAELGFYLGEKKYLEFAKRSFDWMMQRGTGTGWFPAMPDSCNETCAISDMISIAVLLGRSGYTEYFDYAERYFRNYIVNLQFIVSPELEVYYRRIHADNGEKEINHQLELLRRLQGAIIGGSGINDYENELLGRVSGFSIFGCCAPEGMRTIYTISKGICVEENGVFMPKGLYIHIPFSFENSEGIVHSLFPSEGGVEVIPKKDTTVFIRVPHWTDRDKTTITIDGKPVQPEWSGKGAAPYLTVEAKAGRKIRVVWPLVTFTHTSKVWPDTAPDLEVAFDWLGNSVIACRPPAEAKNIPLFTGGPRILPAYPG